MSSNSGDTTSIDQGVPAPGGADVTDVVDGVVGPDAYATWRATTLGATTEILEHRLVLELTGPVSGRRLLDLGCGDGRLTSAFAERGARVVGIDADVRMLAAARSFSQHLPLRPCFVQGRVERLPFPDAAFDVVIAVTVFCLMPDSAAAAQEAARVLRPGGRLVVGDLGRWSLWAALRRVRGWLGARTWRAAHFSTAAELRALLERSGVSVEVVRGSVYYPPVGALAGAMAPLDRWLGGLTTRGAAFIGVAGTKHPDGT